MSQIIVNFIRVVKSIFKSFFRYLTINFSTLTIFFILILRISFLNKHFGPQFFKKFISLP